MKRLLSKVQRKDSAKVQRKDSAEVQRKDSAKVVDGMMDAQPNHLRPSVNEAFESSLQSVDDSRKTFERSKGQIYARERTGAWDRQAKLSASDAERKAAIIVLKIREHERDNLFGNKASEAIPGPDTRDMGGQFLTNKKRIETESRLFNIAKEMPKGCHLHLHFNAELDCQQLIKQASRLPDNMFIRSTRPMLSDEDYEEAELVFSVLPANTPTADIFCPKYNPAWRTSDARPWMRWADFRTEFNKKRPSIDAEDWIKDKMVLSEDEVYGTRQTVNGYVTKSSLFATEF
jgi:adenosine deaminase CECR1